MKCSWIKRVFSFLLVAVLVCGAAPLTAVSTVATSEITAPEITAIEKAPPEEFLMEEVAPESVTADAGSLPAAADTVTGEGLAIETEPFEKMLQMTQASEPQPVEDVLPLVADDPAVVESGIGFRASGIQAQAAYTYTRAWNSSYSSVWANYDDGGMPSANNVFTYGDSFYINFATGYYIKCKNVDLRIYNANGSIYDDNDSSNDWYQFTNFGRYVGFPQSSYPPGEYYFKFYYNYAQSAADNTVPSSFPYNGEESPYTFYVFDTAPSITSQPSNQTIQIGSTATFSVTASGTNLRYQWYYYDTSWHAISGATARTYSVTASAANNGRYYYCSVTNFGHGYVYNSGVSSNSAKLTTFDTISANSSKTVSISSAGQTAYVRFVPSSTGKYVFYSTGTSDTYGYVNNSSLSVLEENDDGGDNTNFQIARSFTSGTTYYLGIRYYNSSTTGSINVTLGNVYAISYAANGGSNVPSSQEKLYGKTLTLSSSQPTPPTGYTFANWKATDSIIYASGANYTANAVTTLTAQYTPNQYDVTFNANGGSGAPSTQKKIYGTTLILSSTIPTRSGYTFLGWGTSANDITVDYKAGANYTANSAIALYAIWARTISVNSTSTATIARAAQIFLFEFTPTTTGKYCFYSTGSSDTYGYVYNSSMSILQEDDDSGDSTNFLISRSLTAGTTYYLGVRYYSSSTTGSISITFGNVYAVTYAANGGSNAPDSQEKLYSITLPLSNQKPTWAGHTFVNWKATSGTTYDPGGSYTANAATTLTAQWTTDTYEIKYNTNGGTPSTMGPQTKTHDVNLTLLSMEPTKAGAAFRNWKATDGTTYAKGAVYTKNEPTTLTAQYDAIDYSVTYNANGGSGAPSPQTKIHGTTLVLSSTKPTWSGCTFLGWGISANDITVDYAAGANYTANEEIILYAIWAKNISLNSTTTADVTRAGQIVLFQFTPSASGTYYFYSTGSSDTCGYLYSSPPTSMTQLAYSDDDGVNYNFQYSYNFVAGTTYYLGVKYWSGSTTGSISVALGQSYMVSYSASPGSNAPPSQIKIYGQTLILGNSKPTPPTGYSFANWKATNGTIYDPGGSYTANAATTLTAQYTANPYIVTFDPNGGSVSPQTQGVTYDSAYGTLPTPTKEGNTFDGWYLGETKITSTTKVTTASNHTLTARWIVITRKLTYNYAINGGTSAEKTVMDVNVGEAIDLSVKATKSGWEFVGWTDAANGNSTTKLTNKNMPSSDTTIYAIYEKTLTGNFKDAIGSQPAIVKIYNTATSGVVPAPTQRDYPSWAKRGWGTATEADAPVVTNYTVTAAQGSRDFCGLYQRDIVLAYDANGGSSAPPSQKYTQFINSYNLSTISPDSSFIFILSDDTPSRNGYFFKGWSTNSDATIVHHQPGASIIAEESFTLYAVWQVTRWLNRDETYYFPNHSDSFGYNYYISDFDFIKLANYIKAYYGSNSASADTAINSIQEDFFSDDPFKGSCYGMAATTILHKQKKINMNNFDPDAATLWNVDLPLKNNAVHSAINYYMVSQNFIRPPMVGKLQSDWHERLSNLVKSAQNGDLLFFCYQFRPEVNPETPLGHAIVIIGYEPADDGGHNLIAYDNRYPEHEKFVVYVDSTERHCFVDGRKEECIAIGYVNDMSIFFDPIDIDGPNNDMVIHLNNKNITMENTEISILAKGVTTVTNKSGKKLVFNAATGEISGDMEVVSSSMIVNSTSDGNPAPVTMVFEVLNSDFFKIESSIKGINASILNKDYFASASSENATTIEIDKNGISVSGVGKIDYHASLSMNNSLADMVSMTGSAVGSASLQHSGKDVIASGAANGATLTVFSNTVNVKDVGFSTSANIVLITGDGSGKAGNVDIRYDSDGDGTFDKSVFGTLTKPMANGSTSVTVDYVGSKQLSVTGGNITWSGGNNYVSVDQAGKITSRKNFIKTGSAIIRASNSAGYVDFNVKVKPTFVQWLLIIFLFGWIWM